MLVKTDNQHYTDIADSIRGVVPELFYDGNVNTIVYDDNIKVSYSYIHYTDYEINELTLGEMFEVVFNDSVYQADLRVTGATYYVGNGSLYLNSIADTGEPFAIIILPLGLIFNTRAVGTYYFKVTREQNHRRYKPSEMKPALDMCFADYGIAYNDDGTIATTYGYKAIGCCGNTSLTTVNFSPRTTEIGNWAFAETSNLKNIVIPEGVKTIGYKAFSGTGIVSVTLPESLIEIGNYAFSDSSSYFTTINMPNNITRIGSYAFDGCHKLKITSLPENLIELGADAFMNCQAITISSVPKSLKRLGSSVFFGCYGITNFTFHEDIEEVGYTCFDACKNLTTVTFKGKPNKIYKNSFDRCERLTRIYVPWSEGEVADAPWGATGATITYNYVG